MRTPTTQARDHDGTTALHAAAQAGHADAARTLLAFGADVDAPDHYADTPLHVAAAEGHRALVELLVRDGGADVVVTTNKSCS